MQTIIDVLETCRHRLNVSVGRLIHIRNSMPFYWRDQMGLIFAILSVGTKIRVSYGLDFPHSHPQMHRLQSVSLELSELIAYISTVSMDFVRIIYDFTIDQFTAANRPRLDPVILSFEAAIIRIQVVIDELDALD